MRPDRPAGGPGADWRTAGTSIRRTGHHPSTDDVLSFLSKSPLFANLRPDLLRDGLAAYEQGDFVKAIHVLIPQVECALREFLGRLGVPTRKPVRNHPGVNEAKNMNDILADPRMRTVLS